MERLRPPSLTIACDECAMRHSRACHDCLVTFFVERDEPNTALTLDAPEEQAVRLLSRAGLVPALRHQLTG